MDRKQISENYKFMVDWISVRVDCPIIDDFQEFLNSELLGADDEMYSCAPRRLYEYAFCLNGKRIFTYEFSIVRDKNGDFTHEVYMNGKQDKRSYGILLEFSGDGLRYFGFEKVFSFLKKITKLYSFHFTRFDIACDIFDSTNTIIPSIILAAENKLSFSPTGLKIYKARQVKVYSNTDKKHSCMSKNVDIGSRGGNFARVYDKQLEQSERGYMPASDIPDYWYRIELEVRPGSLKDGYRREYCDGIWDALLRSDPLPSIFLEHLTRFFTIQECKNIYDERSDYTVESVEWSDFVELVKTQILCNTGHSDYLKFYGIDSEFNLLQHYFNMFVTQAILCDETAMTDLYQKYCNGILDTSLSKYGKYRQALSSVFDTVFKGKITMEKLELLNPFGSNYVNSPHNEF